MAGTGARRAGGGRSELDSLDVPFAHERGNGRQRGKADSTGKPEDVDREFVVSFHEVDENVSHYLEENILTYALDPLSVDRTQIFFWQPFGGSNLKETMNGLSYGHLIAMSAPTMRPGCR